MYHRNELFSTLKEDEISSTLSACTLPDKEEYTEQEADRFRECRELIKQGKSYKQAAAYFRRQDRKDNQQDGTAEPEVMLEISELLTLTSEQCSTRISFKEVGQILDSCGLTDKEQYTSLEGERFVEACKMLKQQHKTVEEVAAHFGVEVEAIAANNIEAGIEQTALALDSSGNGIVSEVMRSKAKADASAAPSLYLQHLAEEFGSPEYQAAWHQMESALKAKVMGKSQQRARQILGEIQAIPPSPSPLNALPTASDNGSTTD